MLSEQQIELYRENGYLVIESLVPADEIARLRQEIGDLCARARGLSESDEVYDLEDSHRPERPRVRRIKLPHRVSPAVRELLHSETILAPLRDLLGPDLLFQSSKLNLKSAGFGAPVEWHQDWAFYPHSNDDVLAVGVMLNDVREENGPLMVLPGSHRGPVHDHHSDGVFCGAIDAAAAGLDLDRAVKLTGPAGSVSLHHVRAVHGSALNRSAEDRALLLYEVMAADAWPLAGTSIDFTTLDEMNARMLCGSPTSQPRLAAVPVRIPQPMPSTLGSIYQIQKASGARTFEVLADSPAS